MLKKLLVFPLLIATFAFSPTAQAVPPRIGIDLPTVLTVKDAARKAVFKLNYKRDYDELATIKTIVLDPGHGGENEGAQGVAGILEKYLTMELAYELRDALQQKYPTTRIVMTRYWDDDLSLSARTHMANLEDADLFISLHYNAATHSRAHGFETYFLKSGWVTPGKSAKVGHDETSHVADREHAHAMHQVLRDMKRQRRHKQAGLFAKSIQDQMIQKLDSINRGVKQANFTVLKGALMPAIVVEAGFLTHPEEGMECIEEGHRQKVVDALVQGIEAFDKVRADAKN